MICIVCQDRCATTKAYLCAHMTCMPCAMELSKRLMRCPQCRQENQLMTSMSHDAKVIYTMLNVGTEIQTPVFMFGLPISAQRELRLIRRTRPDVFQDSLLHHVSEALREHEHIV